MCISHRRNYIIFDRLYQDISFFFVICIITDLKVKLNRQNSSRYTQSCSFLSLIFLLKKAKKAPLKLSGALVTAQVMIRFNVLSSLHV